MKITKRIFALLTALVLCLAPMALMVGAAETIDTCSVSACQHIRGTYISHESEERDYVGSYDVCYIIYWLNVVAKCNACQEIYTTARVEYSTTTHPTLIYTTKNGITAWYCPACPYYHT